MSDRIVTVGQLRVRLHDASPATASIECGHVICPVGYAAGYRVASELTKIHEVLIAAHAVIVDRTRGGATTSAEMTLAAKLIDLGITSAKETP